MNFLKKIFFEIFTLMMRMIPHVNKYTSITTPLKYIHINIKQNFKYEIYERVKMPYKEGNNHPNESIVQEPKCSFLNYKGKSAHTIV